ncbi:transmembrane protein 45B-like [Octopus sinensis]|uniref:Transmembrane protein 45B-like n=1 Tax=Octopus sinensis TaxID=2607531 RepID=A0A6P7TR42_9MOLL|nr:transmembrane protein 45B-like [Octopus sinensis]XP_029654259.1 transmembrane protein 45B-like [Octopus sinensis]XP_036355549.1 transmembrane protein 45B-like [Octopus sinensis]
MGTFGGHALPGTFFLLFAFWYTVQIFNRYFQCRKRNARFTSTVTFPCTCLCGRLKKWPLESIMKIVLVIIGFSGEIITGLRPGPYVILGNGQHATMFFAFGLSGVVELLLFFKAPLPTDVDYIANILAFTIELVLFTFHLHGRSELDVLLHVLLTYVIIASLISAFIEMKFRHNVLAPLARTYFVMLQGSWFWQVGFILYRPFPGKSPWKGDDHSQMMLITIYFAWHSIACFIIILLFGGIVSCYQKGRGVSYVDDDMIMKRLIHTGTNGQTLVSLNDDSESDIEYQKPSTVK